MDVEIRHGSLYLYSARRVGPRVVKAYVGPLSEWDALLVRHRAAVTRERRATLRVERLHAVAEGAAVVAALDPFDYLADRVFRAVMHLLGFRGRGRRSSPPSRR